MPRLILVKHSAPETDPARPASQWRLSETGRLRCRPLADGLAAYAPGVVVRSVEPKAAETAAIVAGRLGRPLEVAEGLHEHDRTGVGWLPTFGLESAAARLFAAPADLVFGRETADQAGARFERVIRAVLEAHPDETVAVVAHGTVITLFVAAHAGVEPLPFWKRLGLPSFAVLSLPELRLLSVVERVEAEDG